MGALGAAAATPAAYRGLILISPVMEYPSLDESRLIGGWKGKPALILHGVADDRIPMAYVSEHAQRMSEAGIALTTRYFGGEDHFLMFSQWDQVSATIAQWLNSSGLSEQPEPRRIEAGEP